MNDQLIRVLHQDSSSCITVAGSFVNTLQGRRSHLKSEGVSVKGYTDIRATLMVFYDDFTKTNPCLLPTFRAAPLFVIVV